MPQTDTLVFGIQFKIAARAWRSLLGSRQPGSLSLAIPAPTAPSSHCPLTGPTQEPGFPPAAACLAFHGHASTGTSLALAALASAWPSASERPLDAAAPLGHTSHCCNCTYFGFACDTRKSQHHITGKRQEKVCGAVRLYSITYAV